MAHHVYVSIGGESKILRYVMDPRTGDLEPRGETPVEGSPGALGVDPGHKVLHVALRSVQNLASYRIDPGTGSLTHINTVRAGLNPVYTVTDRKGRFLLTSSYGEGQIAVFPLGDDGSIGEEAVERIDTADKAHSIQTDPTNRFVFVPHVAGPNLIFQFRFDDKTGRLEPNAVPTVSPKEPEGPRHFCFHPSKDIVYFVNEQGGSVTAYNLDTNLGTLSPFQTLSTLPDGFSEENSCAEIRIHPSGAFLYASNRGHDSIAICAVDGGDGRLTMLGQQATEPIPRAFTLDPAGNFLFVAGQASGKLAAYRVDDTSGALDLLRTYDVGKTPSWVEIVDIS